MKPVEVKFADATLLAARVLLALLFLIFGWRKLVDYPGTVQFMMHIGAPLPPLATLVAIFMEAFVSIAIILGAATRPLAVLLALYTLGTALIAHHYWTAVGMERLENEINFYKNVSIMGGLLVLYVAGAGRYSIDYMRRESRAEHGVGAGG